MREDLLRLIWMQERYDSEGEMIRAPGYHEYPEILDMAQRECIYGIQLDLLRLELKPLAAEPFRVRYGRVSVRYSPEEVFLQAPGEQDRTVVIHGLTPSSRYVGDGVEATTDAAGVLQLQTQLSRGVTLRRHQS